MSIKTSLRKTLIDLTGYWIYKKSDLPVGTDLMEDLKQKIRLPLNTIFDVGANIGQTALKFNSHFPDASIFSFEPVKATFTVLQKNARHAARIKCYHKALGDKEESVQIKLFPDSASVLNSLNEKAMNSSEGFITENIEVTTGDKFCTENNIANIDLLKIDTEGYELQVLSGFSKMISDSKIKMIYCEVGFSAGNTRNTFLIEILNFALQNGYQLFGLYEVVNMTIKNSTHYGNILLVSRETLLNMPDIVS